MAAEHLQVLEETRIRISTVGGNDEGVENLITSGQLADYFDADPLPDGGSPPRLHGSQPRRQLHRRGQRDDRVQPPILLPRGSLGRERTEDDLHRVGDDVDAEVERLEKKDIHVDQEPTDQRWLWREARLRDAEGSPSGCGCRPTRSSEPSHPGPTMGDEQISRGFRDLGHPHRLTIVRALLQRDIACCSADDPEGCGLDPATWSVGELGELMDISPSTLSRHLKELEEAGIIDKSREGRFIYCRVDRNTLERLAVVLGG